LKAKRLRERGGGANEKKKKPIVRQGNHPSSCKFITTKSNYCRTRPSLKTSITLVSKTEKVVRQTNQSCP